jgi:quercetin dioxygenase-like cupin family protein
MTESLELHLPEPDPDAWVTLERTGGIRVNTLWEHPGTGASIALLDVPEGAGIPVRHRHASNQFMYCLQGTYRYLEPEPGLTLQPGHFYMNPKGHPHGPTRALTRCLLLEVYDGPHYAELPPYHTAETVGRLDPGA